jgi:hypothetical protein
MRSVMFTAVLSTSKQKAFRDKARLNSRIARDLAESFGGKKVDYLKRLNGKLKREIHLCIETTPSWFSEAA